MMCPNCANDVAGATCPTCGMNMGKVKAGKKVPAFAGKHAKAGVTPNAMK